MQPRPAFGKRGSSDAYVGENTLRPRLEIRDFMEADSVGKTRFFANRRPDTCTVSVCEEYALRRVIESAA